MGKGKGHSKERKSQTSIFKEKKEKKIKNREKDLSYYSDMLLDYFLSFDPLFSIAMQFLTPIFHLRHTYVFSK
jgi:hypothetical protein